MHLLACTLYRAHSEHVKQNGRGTVRFDLAAQARTSSHARGKRAQTRSAAAMVRLARALVALSLCLLVVAGKRGHGEDDPKVRAKAGEMQFKGLFNPKVKSFCKKTVSEPPRGKLELLDNELADDLEPDVPAEPAQRLEELDGDAAKAGKKAAHGVLKTVQFLCAGDVRTVCGITSRGADANTPSCPEMVQSSCPQCFAAGAMDQACLCTCEQGSAAVRACVGKRDSKGPGAPHTPKPAAPPKPTPSLTPSPAGGARRALHDAAPEPKRGGPEGKGDPRGVKASLKAVRDCFSTKYAQLSAGCKAAIEAAGGLGGKMKPVLGAEASPDAEAAASASASASAATATATRDDQASARAVALLDATQDVFEVIAEEDESTYSVVMKALLGSGAGILVLALAQPYAKRATARWQRDRQAAQDTHESKRVGHLSAAQLAAYVDSSTGPAEEHSASRTAALVKVAHSVRGLLRGLGATSSSDALAGARGPGTEQLEPASDDVPPGDVPPADSAPAPEQPTTATTTRAASLRAASLRASLRADASDVAAPHGEPAGPPL